MVLKEEGEEREIKTNKNIGIIIAIVAIVAILLSGSLGIGIILFVYFGFIIVVGYIIIDAISKFANRLIDALGKRQSAGNEEINAKIELMMQRMQVIEDKVDKTNAILEKASD